jgi:hypothetical protein
MGQKRRHRGDDAGAVRAGQGQDELMIGHDGLDYNSGRRLRAGCLRPLLYHRQPACANPETGGRMNKVRAICVGAKSWLTD